MKEYQSLSHTRWDCKYHVVYIPKRRKKRIFGQLRRHLGEVFHELAEQRGCRIVEGHLMSDHVHMCITDWAKVIGLHQGVCQRWKGRLKAANQLYFLSRDDLSRGWCKRHRLIWGNGTV